MPPCRWLRNRRNENVISVTQTFSSASLTAGDRPGLAAVCILSRCSWPRVSRTGGSALSDLHKNTPLMHQYAAVQQWQGQLRASAASLVSATQRVDRRDRRRSLHGLLLPRSNAHDAIDPAITGQNLPSRVQQSPAARVVISAFIHFLSGFCTPPPARVHNRRANVGPCEVRICVKLNKVTVERSRASTHFFGPALLPCSPPHR